jgi:hypothetical protein
MDKQALINENALKQKEADRRHQEDLDRIRQERDDRLAELAEEEALKLQREREDFELKQQRAKEDHEREMEQLRQEISDRLMEFARAVGEEYDLNDEAVNNLYNLLQQYYGPNGYFDGLYDYSYKSLVSRAQAMLAQVNTLINQAKMGLTGGSSMLSLSPTFLQGYQSGIRGSTGKKSIGSQASGGTYLATRPTTATFGEAGPEIATFIPLRKMGVTAPAGASPASGADGHVNIELWLSPDLESRIISNTLNETASVITRVSRSK